MLQSVKSLCCFVFLGLLRTFSSARLLVHSSALTLVWLYQTLLSPFTPNVCRFTPSCSSYAHSCITQFGVAKGSYFTLKRLCRCHPFGGYGYDPPPENLNEITS